MSKHTSGPWRFDNHLRVLRNDRLVAVVHAWDPESKNDRAQAEADAAIIAAAPELLEACKRLLKFNRELCEDVNVSTHYPSADFAAKAIAKAEGGKP